MQIQARADVRRSLHPSACLLGRWLGGLRARAISNPPSSDQAARPYVDIVGLGMA